MVFSFGLFLMRPESGLNFVDLGEAVAAEKVGEARMVEEGLREPRELDQRWLGSRSFLLKYMQKFE